MAEKDACEGAVKELFVVPCVELEDTFFRSLKDVNHGCTWAGCGPNRKRCGLPDPLRYTLVGSVKREV